MCVQSALAHQAIHPFEVGKLIPTISRGNNALDGDGGVVGSSLYMKI